MQLYFPYEISDLQEQMSFVFGFVTHHFAYSPSRNHVGGRATTSDVPNGISPMRKDVISERVKNNFIM
jgi:hypothetical protein